MRNTSSLIINFFCGLGSIYLLIASSSVFSAPAAYVDANATGSNNGSSWEHAYTDLQDALSTISSGEIWVAAGSYRPGSTRAETFNLRNNIALYGGFSGSESTREQRNPDIYETILNGDILGDDEEFNRFKNGHAVWINLGDNSHHVVTAINVDATAILDGFVIVRGWAISTGAGGIEAGGGLLIQNGSPSINNTKIKGSVGYYGGGAYVHQGSAPTFTNCEFRENYGDIGWAGAMHIDGSSSVTFNNCHFEGNAAIGTQSPAGYGGALSINLGSTATITNSSFVRNITGYRPNTTGGATATKGGAIMAGGDVFVADSVFIGNSSHNGGAIYAFNNATLINNVFTGNRATTAPGGAGGGYGGALILTGPSKLVNNTITSNSATEGTGGIIASVAPGESVQISNTILWGNTVSRYIPDGEPPLPVSRNQLTRAGDVSMSYGILEGLYEPIEGEDPVDPADFPGVLDTAPLFEDPVGPDGYAGNDDDDLHLGAGSPAIDSGDNTAIIAGTTTDIDGDSRFQDDPDTLDNGNGIAPIVDMGAYEFTGTEAGNIAPIAVASAIPTSGAVPLVVTFDGEESHDPDGEIISYEWSFGDGTSSTLVSPSHTYDSEGAFVATLTVNDDQGVASIVDAVSILVGPITTPITAIVSSDWIADEAVAPLLVEFDGSKSSGDNPIISYSWNFGDGTTGTGDTVKHTFEAGTYTITLTVTDDQGAIDMATDIITVDPDPSTPPPVDNQVPVAIASSNWTAGGVASLVVGFNGASSYDNDGTIVSYSWDFGDGSAAMIGSAVEHTFNAGSYAISLTVTDDKGAMDTNTVTITVDATPPPVDNTIPAAPTNLTATLVKTGKGKDKVITDATLNWVDNSNNETGFVIEHCLEQTTGKGKKRVTTCNYEDLLTTSANTTGMPVSIESGYRYRVKAVNIIGFSVYTNEVAI